jgi:hypothetical protein
LSEIGPGVRSATLNCFADEAADLSREPEQAPKVIARKTVRAVENRVQKVDINYLSG